AQEIQMGIDPIIVLHGKMSRRALSMVFEWTALHQQELLENWWRLRSSQAPEKIEPLD
ncbi:MAG TPA: DUF4160 domain-containing protein, partial [Chloroflexi bacterium]|nr:DUF4160 domain-containing protein [Chloroflexota bacterium]